MPVDTAKIKGRRDLEYRSFDELLADADRLSSGSVKTLGNWSPGQIFQHLANTFNGSIDGYPKVFPWYICWLASFFKKKMLSSPMPPGLKLPSKLAERVMPGYTSSEQGLAELRAAISRLEKEPHRAPHPVFGELSRDEWTQFHLKHANLHMSYLAPE